VLPGKGLCDRPIPRPEGSYRVCVCVCVCVIECLGSKPQQRGRLGSRGAVAILKKALKNRLLGPGVDGTISDGPRNMR
jgi:hypothetical protein